MLLALTSCSSDPSDDDDSYYEDDDLGYEVDDFDWDDTDGEQEATHLKRTQTASIKIKDQGEHKIRVTEYDYYIDVDDPKTGTQTLEIEDLTTGNFRAITFAPKLSAILFESDVKDVLIVKNPDGSYDVDDQPAANGREAVMLLKQNPLFNEASPHGIMLAHAMAQKASPWTSLMKSCIGPQPPANLLTKTEPGAVCERFQDFCDCAACFKLNEIESCKRCPQ